MNEDNKIQVYFIEACTGCTCCSSENFYEGPYTNYELASERTEEWNKGFGNPLSSQFAKYGRNYLRVFSGEKISKNRVIIDGYDSVWTLENIERRSCI